MAKPGTPNWQAIRVRADLIPEQAFQFVREGLAHTVGAVHGREQGDTTVAQPTSPSRHVSGRQLCMGLRDLALERYGMLAGTVLRRWGVRRTDDFGVIVYSMIDRGEMRSSDDDSFDDFHDVFDFDEAFTDPAGLSRLA